MKLTKSLRFSGSRQLSPKYRVMLILLMAVITPVLMFSVYEITATNKSELLMRNAYLKQLDAILFSANQFATDMVTTWRKEIELYGTSDIAIPPADRPLFAPNSPVRGVLFADSALHEFRWLYFRKEVSRTTPGAQKSNAITKTMPQYDIKKIAEEAIGNNRAMLERLVYFAQQNYVKNEAFLLRNSHVLYASVFKTGSQKVRYGFLVIEKQQFLQEILLPRLRSISGDRFDICIRDTSHKQIIAFTGAKALKRYDKSTGLWIVPEHELGIALQNTDLQSINDERRLNLIILIVVLNLMIVTAVFFVYRSIRKEMDLAVIKSEFVSNVSHELRTPLSLIGMFAETLESGRVKTEEKKNEYYQVISQETKRLSRIVNKILNFSQIEAGARTYRFESVDMNQIAETVFHSYQFHFQQKGFDASLQMYPEPLMVQADKEALVEAIINLLDNAMKYSAETKEVAVKCGLDGSFAFVSVTDSGIGISSADIQRIFEKFFRASEGGTHNVKGTGLGLSIVKHIAEAHGGRIGVSSIPKQGSTFTLYVSTKEKRS